MANLRGLAFDEHHRIVYCESCEAEWVPKAHLERARELYVREATKRQRRLVCDTELARGLQPGVTALTRVSERGTDGQRHQFPVIVTLVEPADESGTQWVVRGEGRTFTRKLTALSCELLKAQNAMASAGLTFDVAIAQHAQTTYWDTVRRLQGEPDDIDVSDEPNPEL